MNQTKANQKVHGDSPAPWLDHLKVQEYKHHRTIAALWENVTSIQYIIGDATAPAGHEPSIIAHVCNDVGAWGRGFVLDISKRWPEPQAQYRAWYEQRATNDFRLGAVQLVRVADELWVANLIAQHNIVPRDNVPPIRYDALRQALEKLAADARHKRAQVHMPRIGCGLAGGTWELVQPIIEQTLCRSDIPVFVYDLPAQDSQ